MNLEQKREKDAIRSRFKKRAARIEIVHILGGKCTRCGFSDIRALCIDHIKGGGRKEHQEFGGNAYSKILQLINQGSLNYQILCANCNMIKRIELSENVPLKYPERLPDPKRELRPCGTHSSYRRGCRCNLCCEAHRKYCREAMRGARK